MSRKKPPKPTPETKPVAPAPQPEETKDDSGGWEFRSAKFALRAVAVCFFIAYVSFLAPSAFTWVQTKYVRSMPITALPGKADYYLNQVYKPEKLYKIVTMRPASEIEKTIEMLMPYTARMSTFTFLFYSSRLDQIGKTDEALFWWQYGRYRARFDALRCGSGMAVDNVASVLNLVPHPEFPQDEELDKFTVVKSLKRVLALDAKYPADNLPEDLCEPLRAMEGGKFISVRPDRWADIRYTLRYMTEYRLRQMEGSLTVDETKDLQKAAATCEKLGNLKKKKECMMKLCNGLSDETTKSDCIAEVNSIKK
jgi:hypothetical protein